MVSALKAITDEEEKTMGKRENVLSETPKTDVVVIRAVVLGWLRR